MLIFLMHLLDLSNDHNLACLDITNLQVIEKKNPQLLDRTLKNKKRYNR